jgi:DNA-binding HxlR family transcriptional regulator
LAIEKPIGAIFVRATIKALGGKWKLLILWFLKDQSRRFSELKKLIPEISEKVLIQQLRELEKDDIVERTVKSEVPLKVEYSFTEYGRTLIPVISAMCDWGELHLNRKNIDGR